MSDANRETTTDRTTERTAERAARGSEMTKWLSGIASLVGLWIAVSPFVYEVTATARWNDLLVGAGIFLIAGYNFYRRTKGYATNVGAMSLVALLGLWTLLSPFVIEMDSEAMTWSNVVSGLVAALLAAYVAYAGRDLRSGTAAETR